MELNTSGVNKAYSEMNPGPPLLRLMREREIPVVVGSDSHRPNRVGDGFGAALDLLEEAGFTEVSFFEARQRQSLPISTARASLREQDLTQLPLFARGVNKGARTGQEPQEHPERTDNQ